MPRLILQPGTTYSAAADLPWFVSRGMVESYLEKKGFGPVRWHSASDIPPVVPLGAQPTEWAEATYHGPAGAELSVPDSVLWVHESRDVGPISDGSASSSGPVAPAHYEGSALATTKPRGSELPVALVAAAIMADVLVFGVVFKTIKKRRAAAARAPAGRKPAMNLFTTALVGLGAFAAFAAFSNKAVASPGAKQAITQYQLNTLTDEQLFTLGMNPPTADIYLTEGILYLLQKRGRGDLYTGVWNAAQQRIRAQQQSIQMSAEAAQAAEAAAAAKAAKG